MWALVSQWKYSISLLEYYNMFKSMYIIIIYQRVVSLRTGYPLIDENGWRNKRD